MSDFIWVREKYTGRTGTFGDGLTRSWTRVFQVRTASKLVGPLEVMFAVDPNTGERIPLLYASYFSYRFTETDLLSLCRKITPTQDDEDFQLWTVVCEYSTESPRGADAGKPDDPGNPGGNGGSGGGASGDPTLEPPSWEWSSWSREEAHRLAFKVSNNVVLFDLGAQVPMNAARQPFDPETREIGGRTLVYERNEASFDAERMDAWNFVVNKDRFLWDGDERTWLCKPITARLQYKGALAYYRVRYEFWHDGRLGVDGEVVGWDHYFLNMGTVSLDVAGTLGKQKPVVRKGQVIGEPVPLDRDGLQLSDADMQDPKKWPNYRQYTKFDQFPFAPLNIVINS